MYIQILCTHFSSLHFICTFTRRAVHQMHLNGVMRWWWSSVPTITHHMTNYLRRNTHARTHNFLFINKNTIMLACIQVVIMVMLCTTIIPNRTTFVFAHNGEKSIHCTNTRRVSTCLWLKSKESRTWWRTKREKNSHVCSEINGATNEQLTKLQIKYSV